MVVSRKAKEGRLVRGIANEDKLLAMLLDMPKLEPRLVDLAAMSLQEQLQHMTQTELLIGDASATHLPRNFTLPLRHNLMHVGQLCQWPAHCQAMGNWLGCLMLLPSWCASHWLRKHWEGNLCELQALCGSLLT